MLLNLLAQADPATVKAVVEASDFLSQKDLKWWFSGLFVLLVGVGAWIIHDLRKSATAYQQSLLQQLTEQRQANAAKEIAATQKDERLIQYISGDHTIMLQTMKEVGTTMRDVGETLKKFSETLARIEQRAHI